MNQNVEQTDTSVEEVTDDLAPETEVSEGSEWEGFAEDFDKDDFDEVVDEVTEIPAEKPEKISDDDGNQEPSTTKVEAPPVQEKPQESVEKVTPSEPSATQEPPQVEAPSQVEERAPLTDEQRVELRNAALSELEKQYVMSEDDALAFEAEPAKALPKLAAQVQLSVYEQVVGAVLQQIPQYVNQLIETRQTTQTAEEAFFSEYEDLASYKEQVTQVAQMWQQMNPGSKLSPKEKQTEIARFARAALGIASQESQTAVAEAPAAPNMAPPQAPPIQPNPQRNQPKDPWADMAEELLHDPDF